MMVTVSIYPLTVTPHPPHHTQHHSQEQHADHVHCTLLSVHGLAHVCVLLKWVGGANIPVYYTSGWVGLMFMCTAVEPALTVTRVGRSPLHAGHIIRSRTIRIGCTFTCLNNLGPKVNTLDRFDCVLQYCLFKIAVATKGGPPPTWLFNDSI